VGRNAGYILILVSVIMMILSELGVDITPVLASAGVAGLALSLGAQTLIKDLLGGLFILSENQFYVGDVITIGNLSGTVEKSGCAPPICGIWKAGST
jgi:small conductance mechanosensitive channel